MYSVRCWHIRCIRIDLVYRLRRWDCGHGSRCFYCLCKLRDWHLLCCHSVNSVYDVFDLW